jgi:hypothetical protein
MLQKIPNLLYCQADPSSIDEFTFPLNFQLMAANGYHCSTKRRGMDRRRMERTNKQRLGRTSNGCYLSAIDDVAKESYVDKRRQLGASYGGLFSLYLAGIHNNASKLYCT